MMKVHERIKHTGDKKERQPNGIIEHRSSMLTAINEMAKFLLRCVPHFVIYNPLILNSKWAKSTHRQYRVPWPSPFSRCVASWTDAANVLSTFRTSLVSCGAAMRRQENWAIWASWKRVLCTTRTHFLVAATRKRHYSIIMMKQLELITPNELM